MSLFLLPSLYTSSRRVAFPTVRVLQQLTDLNFTVQR